MRCVWRYDDPAVAEFDSTRQGHFDFHNGVYYPSLAFVHGVSPYGARFESEYPVTRPLPMLSPWTLLLHAPLVAMPVHIAEWFYFGLNVVLLAGVAWFCVCWIDDPVRRRDWYWVALLLVMASRAGHSTLFTGYATGELVLATLGALWSARKRPWLSAMCVAITSCKPTYAIPLFLLMIARGDYRAAWRGLAISIGLAALAGVWLLRTASVPMLLEDLARSQELHIQDPYEMPVNTWTRIDIFAAVAKWMEWTPGEAEHLLVMVVLLLPAAWVLRRGQSVRMGNEADGSHGVDRQWLLTSNLIAVSITTTIYHHVYDAMLVIPAALAVLLGAFGGERIAFSVRLMLGGLLLFVAWNYLSSEQFLKLAPLSEVNHRMLTTTGPVALFAGWLGYLALPTLANRRP